MCAGDHEFVLTSRKTLLSGLTLCFSMYLIKLLVAYLVDEKHNNA